jgi:hypothetical protein
MKRVLARKRSLLVLGVVVLTAIGAGVAYGTTQGAAGKASVESASFVPVHLVLDGGNTAVIGTSGPMAIYARCNAGAPVGAEYRWTTSAAHSSMDAGPENDNIGPADVNWRGPEFVYEGNYSNGTAFSGVWHIANPVAELAGGNNNQNAGHCVFGGEFIFYKGFAGVLSG